MRMMNSPLGRSLLWTSIRSATLLELIAAIATASSFLGLINQVGYRLFVREDGFTMPAYQLTTALFVFAVCAAALIGLLYLRTRLDAQEPALTAVDHFED